MCDLTNGKRLNLSWLVKVKSVLETDSEGSLAISVEIFLKYYYVESYYPCLRGDFSCLFSLILAYCLLNVQVPVGIPINTTDK